MTTLGLTLPKPLKPIWKRSNSKSYPTRRIPQILRSPIITAFSPGERKKSLKTTPVTCEYLTLNYRKMCVRNPVI